MSSRPNMHMSVCPNSPVSLVISPMIKPRTSTMLPRPWPPSCPTFSAACVRLCRGAEHIFREKASCRGSARGCVPLGGHCNQLAPRPVRMHRDGYIVQIQLDKTSYAFKCSLNLETKGEVSFIPALLLGMVIPGMPVEAARAESLLPSKTRKIVCGVMQNCIFPKQKAILA